MVFLEYERFQAFFCFLKKRFHNEEVVDANDEKFEDGSVDIPSLTIIQVVAEDSGDYFCAAENQVGLSMPSLSVNLEVFCRKIESLSIFQNLCFRCSGGGYPQRS